MSEEICYAEGKSSLGAVLVATSVQGVVAILIGEDSQELVHDLRLSFPKAWLTPGDRESKVLVKRVAAYLDSPALGLDLDLPLDMRGTDFQKRVWKAVRQIPLGQTRTYTEIARQIGAPKAMRAVGTACAMCNLSLAIPCHRVTRSDGTFNGGSYWTNGRQGILMEREIAAVKG